MRQHILLPHVNYNFSYKQHLLISVSLSFILTIHLLSTDVFSSCIQGINDTFLYSNPLLAICIICSFDKILLFVQNAMFLPLLNPNLRKPELSCLFCSYSHVWHSFSDNKVRAICFYKRLCHRRYNAVSNLCHSFLDWNYFAVYIML